MVTTAKPKEARRGPSQEMVDSLAVYPGEMATTPKVSSVPVG